MTPENTIENKRRFFGLYMNQGKKHVSKPHNHWVSLGRPDFVEDCTLELRIVESLTDEEAIAFAYLIFPEQPSSNLQSKELADSIREEYFNEMLDPHFIPAIGLDYLRSIGIALPWMGLSVEEIIGYGWVKIKEKP